MSNKLQLAVIFGGKSSEHEVSLMSAASIIENLDREKYDIHQVGITKEGQWLLYDGPVEGLGDGRWLNESVPAFLAPDPTVHGLVTLGEGGPRTVHIDCVFPALHGKNGEDGSIQGLFQMAGVPYVGCHVTSSAVCMDKAITHTLLSNTDINQAHYLWFYADRYRAAPEVVLNKIQARLDFPIFVKPANAGSSVGVSKVERHEDLPAAIEKASLEDGKVIVEQGIDGQEVEVAVLGTRPGAEASCVGEIGASAQFYDYDDKYVNGTSQLYIPARLPEDVAEKVRETAVKVYRLLGCSGLARVDFFVTHKDRQVVLNEINTLPGFTSISMYPKLWMHGGLSYSQLLDRLIELGLEEARNG
ncbi:D-alanine--D-alanine ligase family protein [Acutalibacter sp. 1XD8-36]|uniref:D-alanine--D-alanine ligase family protein n=1 Tax=Acutalibacter sp. 1XD8-36 TaxID=2320852 RepID=UPI0014135B0D|nr:D-alanine--D-alanine ligase family protein [Acutalibacter sp. 1XD8-36]NBJ89191.1 D-alanine--D-alanine ligase [Acutalibacter sp. 1XD8-36]